VGHPSRSATCTSAWKEERRRPPGEILRGVNLTVREGRDPTPSWAPNGSGKSTPGLRDRRPPQVPGHPGQAVTPRRRRDVLAMTVGLPGPGPACFLAMQYPVEVPGAVCRVSNFPAHRGHRGQGRGAEAAQLRQGTARRDGPRLSIDPALRRAEPERGASPAAEKEAARDPAARAAPAEDRDHWTRTDSGLGHRRASRVVVRGASTGSASSPAHGGAADHALHPHPAVRGSRTSWHVFVAGRHRRGRRPRAGPSCWRTRGYEKFHRGPGHEVRTRSTSTSRPSGADFPALARTVRKRQAADLPWTPGATSQKPVQVLDAVRSGPTSSNKRGPRTGVPTCSARGGHRPCTRGAPGPRVAAFLGARPERGGCFTKKRHRGPVNLVAYALSAPGRLQVQAGDEGSLITEMEHHAKPWVPWQQLCERTGATLRWLDGHPPRAGPRPGPPSDAHDHPDGPGSSRWTPPVERGPGRCRRWPRSPGWAHEKGRALGAGRRGAVGAAPSRWT